MNDLRSSRNGSSGTARARVRRALPALLAALVALLWVGLTSAPAYAANQGADIEQCRNGTFSSPQQCRAAPGRPATRARATRTTAKATRCRSAPKLINLSTSGSHTLVIEHDTLDSGRHAYDYLTCTTGPRRPQTRAPASRRARVGSSFPIPADPRSRSRTRARRRLPARSRSGTARSPASPTARRRGGQATVIVTFTASTPPCYSPGAATSPPRSTGAQATAPARSPARRTTCG